MKKNIQYILVVLVLIATTYLVVGSDRVREVLGRGDGAVSHESAAGTESEYVVAAADILPGAEVVAGTSSSSPELSLGEREGLVYMREEEKLARDVYVQLARTWGLRVFSNISTSEQSHMDAVREILERYGVADPVATDTPGVFANDQLQDLYTQLVARGSTSRAEALLVGAYVEDLDIVDLDRQLSLVGHSDIQSMYLHLRSGSENHLRAFNRQIVRETGAPYVPEFLTPEAFSAIISS